MFEGVLGSIENKDKVFDPGYNVLEVNFRKRSTVQMGSRSR